MNSVRRTVTCIAVLGLVVAVGCARPPNTPVTYAKHVAPILFATCAGCHRPGQVAPFSVLDYRDVKPFALRIAAATARRVMPPWPPEPGYGEFRNARALDDAQIAIIQQWVRDGAIEGDRRDLPPLPTWSSDWQMGTPDAVVTFSEPYSLAPGGSDVFRNFVLPVDLRSPRYVRGIEFHPGNAKVVHHATVLVDPTRASRRLDSADAVPGYEGMLGFAEGVHVPDGHLLGWTPGRAPSLGDPDKAWRLEPRSDLVVQLHMLPQDTPQTVRAEIGLYFSATVPADVPQPLRFRLGSRAIDIPAGARAHKVTDSYVLPVDTEVLSVNPHAHYLARDIKGFATLPDGSRRWLIWIRDWNFNWQDVYEFQTPVPLPRGTTLTMEFTYDNSADNPRNRHSPPERIQYGPRSTDEMGDLWLQLLPRRPEERAVLLRDYNARAAADAVRDAEKQLEANPDAERHNLLAARYIEAGRLADAETLLRKALRLRPGYARAVGNLGTVLQAQGRTAEALQQFRNGVMLEPDSFDLQFSLGTTLNSGGRFTEAIPHLERALVLDPGSAEAHNNLAVALGSRRNLAEAIQHFRRAVELRADYADAEANLGKALGMVGATDDAARHLARALAIEPDHADAREQLAKLRGR
jgi:Flp pilus assembly protein TadD/mono/diheme cytochrome c family protein